MAVLEVAGGFDDALESKQDRLCGEYEAVIHQLDDLTWLRHGVASQDRAEQAGALRALAGLHCAALRLAVIAVFGPRGIDARLGRPRLDIVTPDVEASLVARLAASVGVPPGKIRTGYTEVNRMASGS